MKKESETNYGDIKGLDKPQPPGKSPWLKELLISNGNNFDVAVVGSKRRGWLNRFGYKIDQKPMIEIKEKIYIFFIWFLNIVAM